MEKNICTQLQSADLSLQATSYKLQAGFTLLMASLVGSMLLAIGLAIFNLALKEVVLSSSGRESQFAFFAADSGSECALYWDFKNVSGVSAFATSTSSTISCNYDAQNSANQNITVGGGGLGNPTSVFSLTFNPDPYCVTVSVTKGNGTTVIESRGYNTCNVSNPRRVERALRVEY